MYLKYSWQAGISAYDAVTDISKILTATLDATLVDSITDSPLPAMNLDTLVPEDCKIFYEWTQPGWEVWDTVGSNSPTEISGDTGNHCATWTLYNYATGTVTVNGNNVIGAGTTFTTAMVGMRISFDDGITFYTISGYTNATTLTLSGSTEIFAAGTLYFIGCKTTLAILPDYHIYARHTYNSTGTAHLIKFYPTALDRANDTNVLASGTRSGVGTLTAVGIMPVTVVISGTPANGYSADILLGTTQVILRAPWHDAGLTPTEAQHVYVLLAWAGSVAYLSLYERWNNNAHTALNGVNSGNTNLTTYAPVSSVASAGVMYVTASKNHLGLKSASGSFFQTFISQQTRRSNWDTLSNGYPPAVCLGCFGNVSGYQGNSYTRRLGAGGVDVVGVNALPSFMIPSGKILLPNAAAPVGIGDATGPVPGDTSKNLKYLFQPIYSVGPTANDFGGNLTFKGEELLSNIWYLGNIVANNFDEITKGTETFIIWFNNLKVAVRKG